MEGSEKPSLYFHFIATDQAQVKRYTVPVREEIYQKLKDVSIKVDMPVVTVLEALIADRSEEALIKAVRASTIKPRRVGRKKKSYHT